MQQDHHQQQYGNPGNQQMALHGGMGNEGMSPEPEGGDGDGDRNADKALTSRFRGVCWNKKNRRWQAAINSSGKYLYLGSYQSEEDAARAFDRAAIRLRGKRGKLNFTFSDYTDEAGNLKEDSRLAALLSKAESKSGGSGAGRDNGRDDGLGGHRGPRGPGGLQGFASASGGGGGDWPNRKPRLSGGVGGDMSHMGAVEQYQAHLLANTSQHQYSHGRGGGGGGGGSGGGGGAAAAAAAAAAMYMGAGANGGITDAALRAALYAQGLLPGAGGGGGHGGGGSGGAPLRQNQAMMVGGGQQQAPQAPTAQPEMRLPPHCMMSTIIPGEDDTCGVVYVNSVTHQVGSAVFDGLDLHDLGLYDSERDARQAALSTMRVVLQHKRATAEGGNPGPLYGLDQLAGGASHLGMGLGAGAGGRALVSTPSMAHQLGGGGMGGGGGNGGLDALALLQSDKAASALLLSMTAGGGGGGGGGGGFDGLAGSLGAGMFGGGALAGGGSGPRSGLTINIPQHDHGNALQQAAAAAAAAAGGGGGAGGAGPAGGGDNKASYSELFQWLSTFSKDNNKPAQQAQQQQQLAPPPEQQQQQQGMDAASVALLAQVAMSQFGASNQNGMNHGMHNGGGDMGGGFGTKRELGGEEGDMPSASKRARGMSGGGGGGGGPYPGGGGGGGGGGPPYPGDGGGSTASDFAAMAKLGTVRLADALKTLFPYQPRGPAAPGGGSGGTGGGGGGGPM